MNIKIFKESPFKTLISFHKLIESLEETAASDVDYKANYAQSILDEIETIPEFKTGIEQFSTIEKNKEIIQNLLAELFPKALTHNEIKAVTIPFQNLTFNFTERFKTILRDAGDSFDMTIRDFSDDEFYIMSCILILNSYYKQNFDISRPLFYDIPDSDGIHKHYRILYNVDFIEIMPTNKAISLTQEDINLLMDNYGTIAIWKEKFPKDSWILKGFGIVTLFNATIESAVSHLKSSLLKSEQKQNELDTNIQDIFRSIFKIPDLRVGLMIYNQEESTFTRPPFNDDTVESFILSDNKKIDCEDSVFGCSLKNILDSKKPFSISNVSNFGTTPGNREFALHLLSQNIQSCILAPVVKGNRLLGIMELVSSEIGNLNSLNANNLDLILPYIVDTLERYNNDLENQLEAIIQREYTAIHSSVYWKFKKEVQKYFQNISFNKEYVFKEIVFKEVYPLYGQIDIKSSSFHRNQTVKEDLRLQLHSLLAIFDTLKGTKNLPILEQRKFEMKAFVTELEGELKTDTEQQIQNYIKKDIHPIITKAIVATGSQEEIKKYFSHIDPKSGLYYESRKKFDEAMSIINKKMASIIDKAQLEAQNIFPHYFERFKTDGVEHNLYIGAAIAPDQQFDKIYLSNLRLWQLQTLCKMELEHHRYKSVLPYELEVTSLILVFSSPISIRFRMDEKRFDVDGTYNARYEVVKKRIDKANIKDTEERITQQEKITIVYSHKEEEREYLKYIKFLQFKNILEPTIEQFDVEELQGVSGLKGIRIKVVNTISKNPDKQYTYDELLEELD
ncbi:GAF domain-containing protein [Flavobacterium sp.]|uniref:GAF domain-containing protein n=1 Tax=Flavobacterium sp. TaxID=239 RepID=UPI002631EC41|nr:GAF domain-containing protein [Flavobacterium sp.]MDG2433306.1 GAF domain-containing protein [Flavobacterium sp.]